MWCGYAESLTDQNIFIVRFNIITCHHIFAILRDVTFSAAEDVYTFSLLKKMNSIGWYLVKIKSECLTHFKRGEHPQPTYPVTNYRTNVVGDYFTIPLILSSFKSWSTFWITRIERKRLKWAYDLYCILNVHKVSGLLISRDETEMGVFFWIPP